MTGMKILTPPPTPFPTCGRLPVAFPLEGRGAATALFAAWDSADTPLEGTTHYTHFAEKIRPQKPRRGDRIQAGVKQSETPAKACAAKALKGRRNTGRGGAKRSPCTLDAQPKPRRGDGTQAGAEQSETPALQACNRRDTRAPARVLPIHNKPLVCYKVACTPMLTSLQSRGFTPACIPSPLQGFGCAHFCRGFALLHPCLYSVTPSGFIRPIHFGEIRIKSRIHPPAVLLRFFFRLAPQKATLRTAADAAAGAV